MKKITIIGAGLAGLSAAWQLSGQGRKCRLVSAQISERAQSVLAEGGINAVLDVMGEKDSEDEHFADTMDGGVQLADPEAVRGLVSHAPELVRHLAQLGVPFAMDGRKLIQRNFGGQKKKRTAYCKSSTGKALMTAMIDAVRQYEAQGLVERYPHHLLSDLMIRDGRCEGVVVYDSFTGEILELSGPVILAAGGPHGMLPGQTTGTTANSGNVLAMAFAKGVEAANLEFFQYHPTTVSIPGKRLLISEAARGEGGRLFVQRDGQRWYFMEEKYPELGNLMPRDVVSREMAAVIEDPACGGQVFLDLCGLSKEIWKKKLPDLREEVQHYLGIDPAVEPVPVSPGIHYFMGGFHVDIRHRTNVRGLYAAGECACQYHGANRLGGNSLLGALYGGKVAAETAAEEFPLEEKRLPEYTEELPGETEELSCGMKNSPEKAKMDPAEMEADPRIAERVGQILTDAMGIMRNEVLLQEALRKLRQIRETEHGSRIDADRLLLAEAMVRSALERKESRGAHQRTDYPEKNDAEYKKTTVAEYRHGRAEIRFCSL